MTQLIVDTSTKAADILPNIRKQFIPDPGYTIVDIDLSGADAQVVAWEADDLDLKNAFRQGMKIHVKNTRDMQPAWADATEEQIKASPVYKENKMLCHATNYVSTAPPLASTLRWPVSRVEEYQERWFKLHPGIKEWHKRTTRFLEGSQCWNCLKYPDPGPRCGYCSAALGKTVKNAFGYRIVFFGHLDRTLAEAVAWVPQSTVAIVTQRGMLILEEEFPEVELLLQVHDSLVFQIPTKLEHRIPIIVERLNKIKVPYDDPLYIPWGVAMSRVSWGACG